MGELLPLVNAGKKGVMSNGLYVGCLETVGFGGRPNSSFVPNEVPSTHSVLYLINGNNTEKFPYNSGFLFSFVSEIGGSEMVQFFIGTNNTLYMRYLWAKSWSNWKQISTV